MSASCGCAHSSSGVATCTTRPDTHHANAIAEREGLGLVVRDVDRGRPELVEDAAEIVEEPIAEPAIERSERLVQQEDARLGSERARKCDALLLAARQ